MTREEIAAILKRSRQMAQKIEAFYQNVKNRKG
jgi:hypothetical protein